MTTTLLKNAAHLLTMDDDRRIVSDGSLFIRDRVIEAIGPASELPQEADRVVNAEGMILLPGLVNTHHHLYQTLTRAVPAAQNAGLFRWLGTLYPIRANLTGESV